DDVAGRASRLYDKPKAPSPTIRDDASLANKLYDSTVRPGNPAWRTAVRPLIENGLILRSEADKDEVEFMNDARQAGLRPETVDAIVGAVIGKPPASEAQRDEFERATRRRLAQEF